MSDLHYTSIDWANITHQRIVADSLVQGAYNLESERHVKNMHGMEKAQELEKRLGFEIYRPLIDADDGSYFGTIFKYKYELLNSVIPPKFVIAFRGTCLDPETKERDLNMNCKFILHQLHESERCEHALNAVEEILSISEGHGNVWLTGHSLGSAIALIIGRKLVIEKESHVKTYLFNPPFVSFSMYKPLNTVYWVTRSVVTGGLDMVVHYHQSTTNNKRHEAFNKLRSWSPYIFVNEKDEISNGYNICFFKQRMIMSVIGASKLENRATENSLVSLIGDVFGGDFEPVHLIPSANLTRTQGSILNPLKSHGIKQWWHRGEELKIKSKSYVIDSKV